MCVYIYCIYMYIYACILIIEKYVIITLQILFYK